MHLTREKFNHPSEWVIMIHRCFKLVESVATEAAAVIVAPGCKCVPSWHLEQVQVAKEGWGTSWRSVAFWIISGRSRKRVSGWSGKRSGNGPCPSLTLTSKSPTGDLGSGRVLDRSGPKCRAIVCGIEAGKSSSGLGMHEG